MTRLKSMFTLIGSAVRRVFSFARSHLPLSAIGLLIICGGAYTAYAQLFASSSETTYYLDKVEKGTIVSKISASGQVSASDEVTLKPQVSGDITWVGAAAGQRVSKGQAIASIESTSARRAVTDAQLALEQAELALEEQQMKSPIDYASKQQAVERAKRDLEDAYDDGYTALADAFVSLPDIVSGVDSFLTDNTIDRNYDNKDALENFFVSVDDDRRNVHQFAVKASDGQQAARTSYDASIKAFRSLSRASDPEKIESALKDAEKMAGLVSEAATNEVNFADVVVDTLNRRSWTVPSGLTTLQSSARTRLSNANSVLSGVTKAQKAIEDAKDALTDAEHDLALASVSGSEDGQYFDVKEAEHTVAQKQAALADAQETLAKYTIRAPFSGMVASVDAQQGDSASSGTSIATVITDQRVAELSLSEVEVASVAVGDKAALTFDALDDVSAEGVVSEIDAVGTVSQGVVSYAVKITFDAKDDRIKPGMTVNADITVESKEGILVVPSSAVKTAKGKSYVEAFDTEYEVNSRTGITSSVAPTRIPVEVGITDDTDIEIVSGLDEGKQIVIRSSSGSESSSGTSSSGSSNGNSGFGAGGPPGGGMMPSAGTVRF